MLPDINQITEELQQAQDLPKEYQEYLERLEKDYLSACITFVVIRDLLLTATANSANISMSLLCLNIGLGAFSSGVAGFMLGIIPAIIDIRNADINLNSEYKIGDISKFVFGLVKILASSGVAFNAVKEYKQLMDYSRTSIRNFEIEVKKYEVKVQPNGLILTLDLHVILGASCLLALIPILLKLILGRRY